MPNLPAELAERLGGTPLEWAQRLRHAGLPTTVPEARLTTAQRLQLRRLIGHQPTLKSTEIQPPPATLRQWARQSLHRALLIGQPWALAEAGLQASLQRSSLDRWSTATTASPAEQAAPLPLPLQDPILQQLQGHPEVARLSPPSLRVLALLVAAARHHDVAHALRALVPGARGRGWPVRLVQKVACPGHAGAVLLPPSLALRERSNGVDYFRLAAPPRPDPLPVQPPPATTAPVPGLLQRLEPLPDDLIPLVLAPQAEDSLRDLRLRWQFRTHLGPAAGPGVVGLLAGPAGHGRRTAARKLAESLHLDVYLVRAALLGSRWIGETEARISQMFAAVAQSGGALLVEDAQDVFCPRVEVHGANDRYANTITNHLLQEIERFPGLVLLIAPSLHRFDAALRRRVHVTVRFEETDRAQRAQILAQAAAWLLRRLPQARPRVEPTWWELADSPMTPAQLLRAMLDAGFALARLGGTLDHDTVAQALALQQERSAGLVRQVVED